MTKPYVVLFDLDGTLIDSEPVAARTVLQCFENWGIQVDPVHAQYVTGRTWKSALEYLAQKYPLPHSFDETMKQLLVQYRKEMENNLVTVPGAVEAVQALASVARLGLVSGSGRDEILFALDRMKVRDYFEVILGAEDYPRSKPAPDGYAKALQHLNGSVQNSLVFEDSTAGIDSAKTVGISVVAITSTNHFKLKNDHADLAIPDLREVNAAWIHRFFDSKARAKA